MAGSRHQKPRGSRELHDLAARYGIAVEPELCGIYDQHYRWRATLDRGHYKITELAIVEGTAAAISAVKIVACKAGLIK